jgi:hypothetical protein
LTLGKPRLKLFFDFGKKIYKAKPAHLNPINFPLGPKDFVFLKSS